MNYLCTCLTKTPDIKYHDKSCLYRIELEGYIAYIDGAMPEDCPFADNENTQAYNAWMNGYIQADSVESGEYN